MADIYHCPACGTQLDNWHCPTENRDITVAEMLDATTPNPEDTMTAPAFDLDTLTLLAGAHNNPAQGVCLLEAVAWFRGIPHTDHPACVSPVLGAYGRALNDRLPDDARQALVPFIPRMPGTAGDGLDPARLNVITRWLLTDYAPRWLDLAGLEADAARLRLLTPPGWPAAADDAADAAAHAAVDAAAVAHAAATAAAVDAAAWKLRELGWKCRNIGYRCARVIALRAVQDIRGYDAARVAAEVALAPHVAEFQAAGVALLDAMIAPSGG
jgi:hypothetical protein